MKKHIYFISYSKTSANSSGFGNSEFHLVEPITSIENTKAIARQIEGDLLKMDQIKWNVVVLNFQLLRTE